MEKITPQALRDRGFTYTAAGISGADMWQGVAFWTYKEKQITLRGNVSTARGGTLHIMGVPWICIDSLEDLDKLLSLAR